MLQCSKMLLVLTRFHCLVPLNYYFNGLFHLSFYSYSVVGLVKDRLDWTDCSGLGGCRTGQV